MPDGAEPDGDPAIFLAMLAQSSGAFVSDMVDEAAAAVRYDIENELETFGAAIVGIGDSPITILGTERPEEFHLVGFGEAFDFDSFALL